MVNNKVYYYLIAIFLRYAIKLRVAYVRFIILTRRYKLPIQLSHRPVETSPSNELTLHDLVLSKTNSNFTGLLFVKLFSIENIPSMKAIVVFLLINPLNVCK